MLITTVQRLKSALWYSIGSTIDAISLEQNINATPQFIGALTELVWTQIANSSLDMERFAKYVFLLHFFHSFHTFFSVLRVSEAAMKW